MNMDIAVLASLLFAVLQAVTALQWSPTPKNGDVIHVCAGQNVTVAWGYIADSDETITSIEWTYNGRSQEMVAVFVHGNFVPTPAFANRVQLVPEAGLQLGHVTGGDRGNYSVEVTGFDSAGASFTERRTVSLQVADYNLHASEESVAEYNNSTDQWHGVLVCGNFTYREDPPFTVEWMTPQGTVHPSTYYTDGFFHYLLPNPVREGTYTCRIPQQALPASCAHGNSQEVQVVVDGLRTRMAIMEASNTALKKEVATLKNANFNLTNLVQELRNGNDVPKIAFLAQMSSIRDIANQDILDLSDVHLNIGAGYDPTTGKFTAPLDGVYYFSASAAAHDDDAASNLVLEHVSRTGRTSYLFAMYAYKEGGHTQTGSGQAAVHMEKGEQVFLKSMDYGNVHASTPTVFSGFLIFAD